MPHIPGHVLDTSQQNQFTQQVAPKGPSVINAPRVDIFGDAGQQQAQPQQLIAPTAPTIGTPSPITPGAGTTPPSAITARPGEPPTQDRESLIENVITGALDPESDRRRREEFDLAQNIAVGAETARRGLESAIGQGAFGGTQSTVGLASRRDLESSLIAGGTQARLALDQTQAQRETDAITLDLAQKNLGLEERALDQVDQQLKLKAQQLGDDRIGTILEVGLRLLDRADTPEEKQAIIDSLNDAKNSLGLDLPDFQNVTAKSDLQIIAERREEGERLKQQFPESADLIDAILKDEETGLISQQIEDNIIKDTDLSTGGGSSLSSAGLLSFDGSRGVAQIDIFNPDHKLWNIDEEGTIADFQGVKKFLRDKLSADTGTLSGNDLEQMASDIHSFLVARRNAPITGGAQTAEPAGPTAEDEQNTKIREFEATPFSTITSNAVAGGDQLAIDAQVKEIVDNGAWDQFKNVDASVQKIITDSTPTLDTKSTLDEKFIGTDVARFDSPPIEGSIVIITSDGVATPVRVGAITTPDPSKLQIFETRTEILEVTSVIDGKKFTFKAEDFD